MTPTYKNDGVNYTKRKERNSTQEDMRKILIDGVHVVTGWNAISSDDPVRDKLFYISLFS